MAAQPPPRTKRWIPDREASMITNLRHQLAERRIVRQRSRRLAEELASYSTPAERQELDAILGRHTDAEIAELESVLNRQATDRALHL
ncbi:hypothetical protein KIH74_24465 [Kineosporia sp. J2-2]|uniref:Uncharacterized protein n=1 Tax=Kineosporia corallincola TaxID=2835133 RepID=A0ABS5TM92_9ACTN|nr:hypothetical protein [Kineosporia corallincola]